MCKFIVASFLLLELSVPTLSCAAVPLIEAGRYANSAIAVATDGTAYAWGDNQWEQLGTGTTANSSVPIVVPALSGARALDLGSMNGLALNADGTLYTWGFDSKFYSIPQESNIVSIANGIGHQLALNSDGTVIAWGSNFYGQLGIGSSGPSSYERTPVMVPNLVGVKSIKAVGASSVALKANGTVWVWGTNSVGELGNGTRIASSIPIQVSGLSHIVSISAGCSHTLALKSDGTVSAWGTNGAGQLGDGTTLPRYRPVTVQGLSGIVSVSAGCLFNLALKSDGSVMSWGANDYGQLGNNTRNNSSSPQVIPGLSGVVAISAGYQHALALKSDGTVLAWGDNYYGELGNGSNTDSLVPVTISGLNLGASTLVQPISDSDAFAYAEAKYPNLFPGVPSPGQYNQYHYRQYANRNFLGIDTLGGIYVYGPISNNLITPIGSIVDFNKAILAWKGKQ